MVAVTMVKHLESLRPADDAARDLLRKLGQGEIVTCEVKRPRNVRHHRLFWALMTLVWQQLDDPDRYPTVESLVTEVKIVTGHYDRRDIEWEGRRYPVLTPRSISFAAMDQTAFDAFFTKVCDWIAANVLPGVTERMLREELEILIGVQAR